MAGPDPALDLIHALARTSGAGGLTRQIVRDGVTAASDDLVFPEDPAHAGYQWSQFDAGGVLEELNCGIAAEVDDYQNPANPGAIDPDYQTVIKNMLSQAAHLLGDYDRDGVVEIDFGGSCFNCTNTKANPCGEDWEKFKDDSMAGVPYADWNFDADWDGHVGPQNNNPTQTFGIDFSKFFTGALGGCP